MHVVYVPIALPVRPVNMPVVMQESELLNKSKGKEYSQVRKFKKEKEVIAV